MSKEKRSLERALKDFQRDQEVHAITGLMIQKSLDRAPDLSIEPDLVTIETISQEDARDAFILEDMLRSYMETYYPEFFLDSTTTSNKIDSR